MKGKTRVGLLIVVGSLLFIVFIFLVGSRSFLFSDRFELRSQFTQVAGLRAGANVQYQGLSVGSVSSVSLPVSPGAPIEVTMGVVNEVRPLIHSRTQAQIKTEGLLGSNIIVLVNPPLELGAPPPGPVDDGGSIEGVDPFDLFEITDNALASVERFEQAASSFFLIVDDVREGEGTLGKLVYDPALYNSMVATADATRELLEHLGNDAEALVELADETTQGVKSIFDKVEHGEGTVARLLNDPEMYDGIVGLSDTLQQVVDDLNVLVNNMDAAASWGALGAFRFAELMEAGKHNWLFKRYFEERGYTTMAPFEVREEAIVESFQQLQEREQQLMEWEAELQALSDSIEAAQNL